MSKKKKITLIVGCSVLALLLLIGAIAGVVNIVKNAKRFPGDYSKDRGSVYGVEFSVLECEVTSYSQRSSSSSSQPYLAYTMHLNFSIRNKNKYDFSFNPNVLSLKIGNKKYEDVNFYVRDTGYCYDLVVEEGDFTFADESCYNYLSGETQEIKAHNGIYSFESTLTIYLKDCPLPTLEDRITDTETFKNLLENSKAQFALYYNGEKVCKFTPDYSL